MKIKKITSILIMLLVCSTAALAQEAKNSKNGKETVLFDVSMTCENCKKRIEKNIAYEKGVSNMKVDLPNKTVRIEFRKDKTSAEKLQKALEALGYEATERTNNQKTKEK